MRLHRGSVGTAAARASAVGPYRNDQHPLFVARSADDQDAVIAQFQIRRHQGARALEQNQFHIDHIAFGLMRLNVQNAAARKIKYQQRPYRGLAVLMADQTIGAVIEKSLQARTHRGEAIIDAFVSVRSDYRIDMEIDVALISRQGTGDRARGDRHSERGGCRRKQVPPSPGKHSRRTIAPAAR